MCSTKRPLTSKTGQKSANKKREAQENELLEQAILCMKNESQEKQASKKPDDDDLFGQFITAEIRSIQDPYIKRQTKWKMLSAINEAHSILYAQQAPVSWPGRTWENRAPVANFPLNSFSQPWKEISPTPSHISQSSSINTSGTQYSYPNSPHTISADNMD